MIPLIAWFTGMKWVDIHSIIPLIPQADFASIPRPTNEMIAKMRTDCAPHIEQMSHCKQCRVASNDDYSFETMLTKL